MAEDPGWFRRLVVVCVIAAVALPAVRDRDSFPLSTYPVYASARGRVATINTAVGYDAAGTMHRLSLSAIADTDDPLIAESAVARAVATGRADELCKEIARRTSSAVTQIEVVEERHDIVAWTIGDESLRGRTVHAECEAGP